jgi:signal peptidase II
MTASRAVSAARETGHAAERGSFVKILALVVVPIIVLDQASKYYIRTHMTLYESIAVIPHWFDITFALNPGAAFSMFVNAPQWFRSALLFTLASAAIVVLLVLLMRDPKLNMVSISFALILAGALGNLIDRVRFGRVVDFIDVHYYFHHYPIFNFADSAITIGVSLILLNTLFSSPGRQ